MLKSPSGCSKGRVQGGKIKTLIEKLLIPFRSIMRNKGAVEAWWWGGRGFTAASDTLWTSSDHPLWVTLYLSRSVVKPTLRRQGNEWPWQFKGSSLRGRKPGAPETHLAASRARRHSLKSRGRPAAPSRRDLQSCEYVSVFFVAGGGWGRALGEAPAGVAPPSDRDVRLERQTGSNNSSSALL